LSLSNYDEIDENDYNDDFNYDEGDYGEEYQDGENGEDYGEEGYDEEAVVKE